MYLRSEKATKTKILDEFVAATGLHRKAAVRRLNMVSKKNGVKKPGRPKLYSLEAMSALKVVWEASDRLCSKRFQPFLPEMVGILKRAGELSITQETEGAEQYHSTWPAMPKVAVLLAEIPKGSGRWKQANFDKVTFQTFFGLVVGNKAQHVSLQHVDANGLIGQVEIRQGVSVKLKNATNCTHVPSLIGLTSLLRKGRGSLSLLSTITGII
jgi:hypothetical protein